MQAPPPLSRWRSDIFDGDGCVVDEDTTASARPPSVIMLIVSCNKLSIITDVRMESGIEIAMMTVLRQLPRKIRIISR